MAAWAILELVANAEDAVPFEDALCHSSWWECPRSGVAPVAIVVTNVWWRVCQ